VAALGLAMSVVTSEMTILAVTLPGMGAELGVSAAATAWVLLAYALPPAAVSVPAGRWADGADVRAVFALAMIGLGPASVLVAFAPTFGLVVVGRLLQGIAGALAVAAYMPMISGGVRQEQRGRAIGFVITIMAIGATVGMPLGGLVAEVFTWREVVLMKIPLALIVLWIGLRSIPRTPDRGLPRPSVVLIHEALLLGGAVAALLVALDEVDGQPLVAAAPGVAAVAFGVWWAPLTASGPVTALTRGRSYAGTKIALFTTTFTGNPAISTAPLVGTNAGSEGVAGGVGMTVRTIAMTVAPAVTAAAWTMAGAGSAGFRAGFVVVTATAGLGLLVRLLPASPWAVRPAAEGSR
jgi:MFS family permease